MKRLKRACVLFLAVLFFPAAASAFELDGITAVAGKTIILNAEPVTLSAGPAPVASMLGITVPMRFTEIFYFEPGLRVYGTKVELIEKDGVYKAVPAALETGDRNNVLNFELRPELGALFRPWEKITFGVTGAPVFTFRFPGTAFDDAEELGYPEIVRRYYFSKLRFLGIYAGGFMGWDFGKNTSLILKAGTNLPVYHIWDGDTAGFYDQLAIQPELGFHWRF